MVRAYVLGVLRNLDSVRVYLREEYVLPRAALRQVHAEQRTMRDLFERVIGDGMRDGSFVGTDPKLAALPPRDVHMGPSLVSAERAAHRDCDRRRLRRTRRPDAVPMTGAIRPALTTD